MPWCSKNTIEQNLQLNSVPSTDAHVWLRIHCNYDTEKAVFSYSTDGTSIYPLGDTTTMIFQLRTFQGVRTSLFNFNNSGVEGGYADFNNFIVNEPRSYGLTRQIPNGKLITLTSLADSTVLVNWRNFVRPVSAQDNLAKGEAAQFKILDRGNGRVALQSVLTGGFVTIKGPGVMAQVRIEKEESSDASLFQWQDMLRGDLMLMSLKTHRYLFADPFARSLTSADLPWYHPRQKRRFLLLLVRSEWPS